MQDSVFLRRILTLLIGAILLSAFLTLGFYYFITSDIVYSSLTTNDFRRKASLLSDQTERFLLEEISAKEYEAMLLISPDLLDASVHIRVFSESGSDWSLSPLGSDLDPTAIAEIEAIIAERQAELEAGTSIELRKSIGEQGIDTLMVGYPVEVFDRSTGVREILAAIVLSQSMDSIRTGFDSLNFALILASGLSVLIMILPTYLAITRLLRPLKQVKDVAIAMSNGNFTLRADAGQPGEIGDLATAINDLAGDLDRTITALLQERNRLRQILDGLNEGIIAVDRTLRITHSNQATDELLGRDNYFRYVRNGKRALLAKENESDESTAQEQEMDFYLSSDLLLDRDYQQTIDSGKTKSRTFQHNDRIIVLAVSPLSNANDEIIGAVGLLRDVTASEKLEQTRRDYIANVSHELRTPLTALRGLIEPLSDGLVQDPNDQKRYYQIILNETLRLSRLIDDMLELSRLQAGKISLKRQRFDLWDLFAMLKDKYDRVARENGLVFLVPDEDDACPLAYSNMDRVEQVLVILIDNAMKFTPKGGIVELGINWEGERIVVSVKDTGVGIAADEQSHVFERFYKTDKSREQQSGTGLGLSIAKEMIVQMGERIWVRSHVDHGSSFFITIRKYESS